MLKARKTIVHSVGSVEYSNNGTPGQRYFINVAGMLLDAHVVREFPDGYKKIPLIPMYLVAGLWHLFMYRPVETVVTSGERTLKGKFLTIHAGICRYSGGGMRFVPHANPTGNTIAVTCIRKMPVIQHLLNTWRLYNGSVLALAKATGFQSSAVRIESPSGAPVPVEADGEFLGYTPVTISMTPVKLQVVVP
jgi:diacylglycerol kinase family enzyme